MDLLLSNGRIAVIDDEDANLVNQFKTWCETQGKAVAHIPQGNGSKVYLHRLVMRAKPRQLINVIDGNYLNCKKENLFAQKSHHKRKSKTIGCYYEKSQKKWRSSFYENRKRIFLGYFETKEEAQKAYLDAKKNSTIYPKGLYWCEERKYYRVYRDRKYLGSYEDFADALDAWNLGVKKNNPYQGVSWCAQTSKWRAFYSAKNIGRFDTKEEARKARKRWMLDNPELIKKLPPVTQKARKNYDYSITPIST